MKDRSRSHVLSLIFLAILGIVAIFTHFTTPDVRSMSIDEQTEHWQKYIQTLGPESAYREFARFEASIPAEDQHKYAHIFGRALYREVGLGGLGTCDARFQYGCLHEYFGHVIAEHGLDILPTVAEACKKKIEKSHPCQHGMGHGILASLGYDDVALLREALSVCNSIYTDDPINGCMGGVFMEYNLYESLGADAKPRDPEKDGWYSPCISLSGEYQRSCAWWLPQWWHEYMLLVEEPRRALPERFRKMGELCHNLPHQKYVRDCFQQIGQLTVWGTDFKTMEAALLCDVASEIQAQKLVCKAYSAYMFNYYDRGVETALSLCEELSGLDREFCETYAKKEAYTPKDIPLPTGPAL